MGEGSEEEEVAPWEVDGPDLADDDGSDMDEEDAALVQQEAFQRYLTVVKEEIGEERVDLYKAVDKQKLSCAVCQPSVQTYEGWVALMAHAANYTKKKPQQHRGYHRALREVIQPKLGDQALKKQKSAASSSAEGPKMVWPPVLRLQGREDMEAVEDHFKGLIDKSVEGDGGLLFCVLRKDPAALMKVQSFNSARVKVLRAEDMEGMQPPIVVEWKLVCWSDAEEECDEMRRKEAAAVKAGHLLQARLIDKAKAQEQRTLDLQMRIEKKREERERCRLQEEQLAVNLERERDAYREKLFKLAKDVEKESQRQIKALQLREEWSLENAQRKKEEEFNKQERLQRMMERGNERIKKLSMEAMQTRALRKEKQEQNERELKAYEEKVERESQEKLREQIMRHEQEMQELVKRQKEEREKALNTTMEQFCAICLEGFDEEHVRSVMHPCGHSNCCYTCAVAVFEHKKECPLCRRKLEERPLKGIYT